MPIEEPLSNVNPMQKTIIPFFILLISWTSLQAQEVTEEQANPDNWIFKTCQGNDCVGKKQEAVVAQDTVPKEWKEPLTGMELVLVKGGCFLMGDTLGEGANDEKPTHDVCVDDFYLGKYEVTQGQWKKIMGKNPSHFPKGDKYPVEQVSWEDITKQFVPGVYELSGCKT